MPFLTVTYTTSGKSIWQIANDQNSAITAFKAVYNDTPNGGEIKDDPTWDYSMLTNDSNKWHIIDTNNNHYAMSGDDYNSISSQLLTHNGGIVDFWEPLTGDFSLITPSGGGGGGGGGGGTPSVPAYIGPNTHFCAGSGNADYPQARQANGMATILKLKMNACRNDIGLNPDGTLQNSGAAAWINLCATNNISFNAVLSVTSASNTVPNTSSNAAIHAERVGMFAAGDTKYYNFVHAYTGKIALANIGSELDVLDAQLKVKGGFGTGIPAAPTGSGTSASPYIWVDKYAGSTLEWDMARHGNVFYYIMGAINGIRRADPTCLVGMNYSSNHTGRCIRFFTDAMTKSLPGCGVGGATVAPVKFNWIGNDWYDAEEYGTDQSGAWRPAPKSNLGTAWDRVKEQFIDAGLCDFALMTETGLKNKTNAATVRGFTSNGAFINSLIMPKYWPFFRGIYPYELFNEPVSRAGSTNGEQYFGFQIGTDDVNTNPSESVQDFTYNPFPKPTA